MTDNLAQRRVERVRHEPRLREATVVGVEPVGASILSVTLEGDDLAGFTSLGFDDHVKFIFPGSHGVEAKRDITPRRFVPHLNRLTLEFAYHEGGEACTWAREAVPGTKAKVGGPKSSYVVPADYDWHLLAGDLTAAPAIMRRLEELPAGAKVLVILLVQDPDDVRPLPSFTDLSTHWTYDAQHFIEVLRGLVLPEGDGFIWAAGEAGLMAQVRDEIVGRRGHPRVATRIAGYWKPDEKGFHETLEKGAE